MTDRSENFIRVGDKAALAKMDKFLMDRLDKGNDVLGFDTETNGLLFFRNVIIGFSISVDEDSGYYVPLLEWERAPGAKTKVRTIKGEKFEVCEDGYFRDVWTGSTYPENVTSSDYRPPEFIVKYLEKWTENAKLVMHNAPFDCNMVAYNFQLDLGPKLFCDTLLLKHFVDEYTRHGLKETAILWSKELGFDAGRAANQEQIEMSRSIIENGGEKGHIWRGAPHLVSKYACADTALTMGLLRVGLHKLEKEYGEKGFDLFFEKEIMPLCREVVIPMRYGGVKINVKHFEALKEELIGYINEFEDRAIAKMGDNLKDFSIGESMEEAVSKKKLVEKIMELEGLDYPTHIQKGVEKQTLSKGAVKKAFEANPHWLWGYVLGQDEIKYSPERLNEIKESLYRQKLERRYRFNINSDQHMRWLLFDKLGNDKARYPQTDSATKSNPIPSMAADVLDEHFKSRYDFIEDVMMFRKLGDLLSNYVEKALSLNNNGWLHMNMNQAGTTSGRFSCSGGFNLQTLPKVESLGSCPKCDSKNVKVDRPKTLLAALRCKDCKHLKRNIICYSVIKEGFVAPKGYKIVNADYSSLEPRCFAYMSGDKKLKDIYFKNLDMYAKVYCDIEDPEGRYSPDPKAPNFLKKANPALRDMVKPVVLGIPYGALGPQVANLMGFKKTIIDKKTGEKKEILDVERGIAWREKYLGTYDDLCRYMEECELQASTRGYVETIFGRRRHFKYAPVIQKILDKYRISKEDFLNVKRKDLQGDEVESLSLDSYGIEYFCEKMRVSKADVMEKGGWGYLRNLYKNELDNAKNVRIQGLAGHICNLGMLDTTRYFQEYGIDGYVFLQVHDEISCYVREDQAEIGAEFLKLGMEQNAFAKVIDVGMSAEPILCDNLKDSK